MVDDRADLENGAPRGLKKQRYEIPKASQSTATFGYMQSHTRARADARTEVREHRWPESHTETHTHTNTQNPRITHRHAQREEERHGRMRIHTRTHTHARSCPGQRQGPLGARRRRRGWAQSHGSGRPAAARACRGPVGAAVGCLRRARRPEHLALPQLAQDLNSRRRVPAPMWAARAG